MINGPAPDAPAPAPDRPGPAVAGAEQASPDSAAFSVSALGYSAH
jgi:hypothetical protein